MAYGSTNAAARTAETDPTVPAWAKNPQKPAYTALEVGAAPITRTINGKPLDADITLGASDVGATPITRTVNGKPLSGDITLGASDVGAVPLSGGVMTGPLTASGNISPDVSAVRNISAGTADLEAGVSPLPTGTIYFLYE